MQIQRRPPTSTQLPDAITILRVKRKRGQEPLDALVIQQQQQHQQQRKRLNRISNSPSNDGCATPLLFALGETISESDFSDSTKLQALQDRLTQLSTQDNAMEVEVPEGGGGGGLSQRRTIATPAAKPPQFRVLAKQQVKLDNNSRPTRGIPQVLAAADLRRARCPITMFDAVAGGDDRGRMSMLPRDDDPYAEIALGCRAPTPSSAAHGAVDDLVPMVRDCLSLDQSVAAAAPEYVYDFYYARQPQSSDAMLSLGSVTWMVDEDIDDSTSEEEDDDVDSNSEGYYANDYPDDESASGSRGDEFYYSDEDLGAVDPRDDDAVDIGDIDGGGMYEGDDEYF
ncbi:hypothetical protein GGF44_003356 [Coemansia sp. RSA 1694]|nr:hypothetical protein GGF44_003356 [Coemansia sp. RSA 1694]